MPSANEVSEMRTVEFQRASAEVTKAQEELLQATSSSAIAELSAKERRAFLAAKLRDKRRLEERLTSAAKGAGFRNLSDAQLGVKLRKRKLNKEKALLRGPSLLSWNNVEAARAGAKRLRAHTGLGGTSREGERLGVESEDAEEVERAESGARIGLASEDDTTALKVGINA